MHQALVTEHYSQKYEFTCGPVCLLMAMKALRSEWALGRPRVMEIWREANLVESTATSAEGLGLAAVLRGFHAHVIRTGAGPPFAERIATQEHGDPVILAEFFDEIKDRAMRAGVTRADRDPTPADILQALDARHPVVVLTDLKVWEPHEETSPHWVVALRRSDEGVAFHDPGMKSGPIWIQEAELPNVMGCEGESILLEVSPATRA